MNFTFLITTVIAAKRPRATKAWKALASNASAFMDWFGSQSSTEEQKIKNSLGPLFTELQKSSVDLGI